jgi:hypothetical protein
MAFLGQAAASADSHVVMLLILTIGVTVAGWKKEHFTWFPVRTERGSTQG